MLSGKSWDNHNLTWNKGDDKIGSSDDGLILRLTLAYKHKEQTWVFLTVLYVVLGPAGPDLSQTSNLSD